MVFAHGIGGAKDLPIPSRERHGGPAATWLARLVDSADQLLTAVDGVSSPRWTFALAILRMPGRTDCPVALLRSTSVWAASR